MSRPQPMRSGEWPVFWDALDDGHVMAQQCQQCGQQQFPPSYQCRRCGAPDPGWQEVSGAGEVYSFTVVHRAPEKAFAPDVPYVIAVAQFSGGARMLARLHGVDPDAVYVGMPVRAVAVEHDGWTSAELQAEVAPG